MSSTLKKKPSATRSKVPLCTKEQRATMRQTSSAGRDESSAICEVIREIIIPAIQEHGASRIAMAKVCFEAGDLPLGMAFKRRKLPGQPLHYRSRVTRHTAYAPKPCMEILRFPTLCFVYGGEADLPVGDGILQCPAGYGVLIPAGVPLGNGDEPHWHRAHPEKATSDILWMNLRAFGAEFHLCHTRGATHESGWYNRRFTAGDPQLFPLIEQAIEELERKRSMSDVIASSYLIALFCLLQRHWDQNADETVETTLLQSSPRRDMSDPALVIRRAKHYIEAHLREALTLETIAGAAYVSRSNLAQLFRKELGQTVWDYVSERRLHQAKIMLAETDLLVEDIARLSGLSKSAHFFVRFSKLTGCSPGEFRRRALAAATQTISPKTSPQRINPKSKL